MVGSSLPLALLIFAGSYFGIWKKNTIRLPRGEAIALFFILWAVTMGLLLVFRALLINQDELTRSTVGNLWGPLLVGIIIGRRLVSWRRKKHGRDQEKAMTENKASKSKIKIIVFGCTLFIMFLLAMQFYQSASTGRLVFSEVGEIARFDEDKFEVIFPEKVFLLTTSSKSGSITIEYKNYKSVVPARGVFNVIVNDWSIDRPEGFSDDKFFDLFIRSNLDTYEEPEIIEFNKFDFDGHPAVQYKASFYESVSGERIRSIKDGMVILASPRTVYNLSVLYPVSNAENTEPMKEKFFRSFRILS